MITLSEYKLTVKLEQYTPLLHFQGDQQGACLRATEVKPKLDRFIVDYLEKQGILVPKTWKLDTPEKDPDASEQKKHNPKKKKHEALRYKMRLIPKGPDSFGNRKIHPLYFASGMGGQGTHVSGVFFAEGVEMTLLSLVKSGDLLEKAVQLPAGGSTQSLLPLIEGLLPSFFALHGFGTRSNKGFGSFGVKDMMTSVDQMLQALPKDCLGFFHMKRSDGTAALPFYENYLDDVYVISAIMKGGVNLPNRNIYKKGEIQKCWSSKGIGTEKAFLKSEVFTDDERNNWYKDTVCNGNDHTPWTEYSRYTYFEFERALLGLPDHYSYGTNQSEKIFSVTYDKAVKEKDERVLRFPNPVVFRLFSDGLLVVVRQIPDKMFEQEFYFRNDPSKAIKTPPKESFDLWDFVANILHPFDTGGFPSEWNDLFEMRASIRFYNGTENERTFLFRDTLNNLWLLTERRNS